MRSKNRLAQSLSRVMRGAWVIIALMGVGLGAFGCGRLGFEFVPMADSGASQTGGSVRPGTGASMSATGGASTMTGGTSVMTGGTSVMTGGATQSGGVMATGGMVASGGNCVSCDASVADGAMSIDAGKNDAATPDAGRVPQPDSCWLGGVVYALDDVAVLSDTLKITAVNSTKCLALDGCGPARGVVLIQQACDNSACQLWEPLDLGGGWYALRSPMTGHCADVNDSYQPSPNLVQWDCWLPSSQKFQATCAGYDEWRLIANGSGDLLTVDGASTSDGALITQTTDADLANQRWLIESQANVFAPIVSTAEVGSGNSWKYTTSSPAAGWNNLAFDDTSWSQGNSGFGQSEGGQLIMRTTWSSADIWMRTSFTLASPLPTALSIRMAYDEDAEVYLNGVLVRSAAGWITGYDLSQVDAAGLAALVVGDNTLAVHCHNTTSPQYIDVGLGVYSWP